jgi:hypothetical protein
MSVETLSARIFSCLYFITWDFYQLPHGTLEENGVYFYNGTMMLLVQYIISLIVLLHPSRGRPQKR